MVTNQFEHINQIINIITLVISLIAVSAFLWKYNLKGIDTPALIIIASYIFKNTICVFVPGNLYSIWDYITPIASTIIFAVLLYFVIEMSYIRSVLEQDNLIHYQKEKNNIQRNKTIMFFLLLGVYFPANMIQFVQQNYNHIDMTIVIIRTASKFIVDVYMFPLFLYHLMFFISLKQQQLFRESGKLGFNLKHKIIIALIIINWFLKFLHALANIFIVLLRRYSQLYQQPPSENILLVYLISLRSYTYIVDFLNLIALLYLFKHQAEVQLNKSFKQNRKDKVTFSNLIQEQDGEGQNNIHNINSFRDEDDEEMMVQRDTYNNDGRISSNPNNSFYQRKISVKDELKMNIDEQSYFRQFMLHELPTKSIEDI